jgi:hypothetical protein
LCKHKDIYSQATLKVEKLRKKASTAQSLLLARGLILFGSPKCRSDEEERREEKNLSGH